MACSEKEKKKKKKKRWEGVAGMNGLDQGEERRSSLMIIQEYTDTRAKKKCLRYLSYFTLVVIISKVIIIS